ncbi:hypothetical protein BDW42DRAFT_159908 [Aspergillus taichungensis]|uniref:Uncharacterized protein n=1 Tax=Aspergillus taichungensis TaxID=482145 RepID=A0A2J5I7B4_9EURO|nr:hypothetical protein BDW42DRAFT_159908 [Aspergillus taichungensis]
MVLPNNPLSLALPHFYTIMQDAALCHVPHVVVPCVFYLLFVPIYICLFVVRAVEVGLAKILLFEQRLCKKTAYLLSGEFSEKVSPAFLKFLW